MKEKNGGIARDTANTAIPSPWDMVEARVQLSEKEIKTLEGRIANSNVEVKRAYSKAAFRRTVRVIAAIMILLSCLFAQLKVLFVNGFSTDLDAADAIFAFFIVYTVGLGIALLLLLIRKKWHFKSSFGWVLIILAVATLVVLGVYFGTTLDLMYLALIGLIVLNMVLYFLGGHIRSGVGVTINLFALLTALLSAALTVAVTCGVIPMSMQYIMDTPTWGRNSVYYEKNGEAVLDRVMFGLQDAWSGNQTFVIPSQVEDGDDVYQVTAIDDYAFSYNYTINKLVLPSSVNRVDATVVCGWGSDIDVVEVNSSEIVLTDKHHKIYSSVDFEFAEGLNANIILDGIDQLNISVRFLVPEGELESYRARHPELAEHIFAAEPAR